MGLGCSFGQHRRLEHSCVSDGRCCCLGSKANMTDYGFWCSLPHYPNDSIRSTAWPRIPIKIISQGIFHPNVPTRRYLSFINLWDFFTRFSTLGVHRVQLVQYGRVRQAMTTIMIKGIVMATYAPNSFAPGRNWNSGTLRTVCRSLAAEDQVDLLRNLQQQDSRGERQIRGLQ